MNDTEQRVENCFASVFPDIAPEKIAGASTASLAEWDSIAHIRLLSAVSEEFGLELEMEDYEDLVSYPAIVTYVKSRLAHA